MAEEDPILNSLDEPKTVSEIAEETGEEAVTVKNRLQQFKKDNLVKLMPGKKWKLTEDGARIVGITLPGDKLEAPLKSARDRFLASCKDLHISHGVNTIANIIFRGDYNDHKRVYDILRDVARWDRDKIDLLVTDFYSKTPKELGLDDNEKAESIDITDKPKPKTDAVDDIIDKQVEDLEKQLKYKRAKAMIREIDAELHSPVGGGADDPIGKKLDALNENIAKLAKPPDAQQVTIKDLIDVIKDKDDKPSDIGEGYKTLLEIEKKRSEAREDQYVNALSNMDEKMKDVVNQVKGIYEGRITDMQSRQQLTEENQQLLGGLHEEFRKTTETMKQQVWDVEKQRLEAEIEAVKERGKDGLSDRQAELEVTKKVAGDVIETMKTVGREVKDGVAEMMMPDRLHSHRIQLLTMMQQMGLSPDDLARLFGSIEIKQVDDESQKKLLEALEKEATQKT